MILQNTTAQKFISLLLILAILSPAGFVMFSKPKPVEAIWGLADVNIQALDIQEIVWKVLEQVLQYIARKLIDKMTQATINWVNEGFKGKPLFIENPKSFFGDIMKTELKGFVDDIGYDKLKFPFGKDYALSVINQAKSQFEQNATYSLSKMYSASELEYQKNNFSAGLWNGLLINTQFPQNNLIGFQMMATKELEGRLAGPASPVQKVKDKVSQGLGFLSQQKCKSNPNWDEEKLGDGPKDADLPVYNPPKEEGSYDYDTWKLEENAYNEQYKKDVEAAKTGFKSKFGCKEGPATITPGSAISGQIMKALGGKMDQGFLAAALGNSLAAIFDALINKLFNMGITGINKLITPPPPKPLPEWGGPSENGVPYATANIPDDGPTTVDPNDPGGGSGTGGGTGGSTGGTGTLGGGGPLITTTPGLVVNLDIINDDGGALTASQVGLFVNGDPVTGGSLTLFSAGTYTVSTTSHSGYNMAFSGDCTASGDISLGSGGIRSCLVTFDDIATTGGGSSSGPKLTVTKIVINDNGGTLDANSVDLFVDGNLRTTGVEYTYSVGTHIVSEENIPGYTATIGGNCAPDGSITLARNDVKTCTITNEDN